MKERILLYIQDGDKSLAIIEKEREKVEEEVKIYFKENYHTNVIIQNIVATEDGASVFVESEGEPYFYNIAIVPVDVREEGIGLDRISTIEGQVEKSIEGGLYVMVYRKKFNNLDR